MFNELFLNETSVACTTTKDISGIYSKISGKANMKATRQKRKTTGTNDQVSARKLLQALPSTILRPSSSSQIITEDAPDIAEKHHTVESRQFLQPSDKFKLQLFPIDEDTRRVLQEGDHNPYLELTLRPRKKISSVVTHLTIKWGIPRTAYELVLFPHEGGEVSLLGHKTWTLNDRETSAADVYSTVGQPEIFRLKYGLYPNPGSENSQPPPGTYISEKNLQSRTGRSRNTVEGEEQPHPLITQELEPVPANEAGPSHEPDKPVRNTAMGGSSLLSWVDCVTSVSVGQLLSETSNANQASQLPTEKNPSSKHISNCDSFDFAIADFIARNQYPHYSTQPPSLSSIWDAEETRHAFPTMKPTSSRTKTSPACDHTAVQVRFS
ncbi:unnamed protein product [Spirodela intermedia]|uniref:Uncharacterized protein n=1 Tax=Spirodela intermedia TaxID=51605 RepID=A0A7I8LJB8_SPIIN|nr:unnamed protein product [Spirodela intermedia]